ncbi:MAG: DUF2125 domain-containing protein [Pseudomonadota bacterium]
MGNWVRIIGGGAVALVLVWTGVWFAGRGEVNDRLDAELDMLRSVGLEISYDDRSVGGFPTGYRIDFDNLVLTDSYRGISYRAPTLSAEIDPTAPDRLTVRLPDRMTASVARAPQVDGTPTPPAEITIAAENMRATLSDTARREATLKARNALIVSTLPQENFSLAVDLIGIDLISERPTPPTAEAVMRANFDRIDFALSGRGPGGAMVAVEGELNAPLLAGRTDLGAATSLAAALGAGQLGRTNVVLQTGRISTEIGMEGSEATADGAAGMTAATTASRMTLENGAATLAVSAETALWHLTPVDGENPFSGRINMQSLETIYTAPLALRQAGEPVSLRLALSNVSPDEALWQRLDPDETLSREDWHFVADIDGTIRPAEAEEGGGLGTETAELEAITLKTMSLNGLGADIDMRGGVTFPPGTQRPEGTLTLRLVEAVGLIGKLFQAGLIDNLMAQRLALLAANYTQRTESGALQSEIVFTADRGILINGDPVGIDP